MCARARVIFQQLSVGALLLVGQSSLLPIIGSTFNIDMFIGQVKQLIDKRRKYFFAEKCS